MQKLTFIFFLLFTTAQAQTWEWTKSAGGNGTYMDAVLDIKTLSNGDVITSGFVGQNAVFGSIIVNAISPNKNSGFVACQDSSGNYKWVQVAKGKGFTSFFSVVVDSNDNIYVAADFYDDFTFGGTQILSNDTFNIHGVSIFKLNSNGSLLWSNVVGLTNYVEFEPRIAIDKNQNIKMLYGTSELNSTSLLADYLILSIASLSGNIVTNDTIGSASLHPWAFDVNSNNNESAFWLSVSDTANIRGQLFYPNGGDRLILKLDSMLNIIYAIQFTNGGAGLNGHTLRITPQSEVVFCNAFSSTLQIQNHSLISPNQFNLNSFIVKIDNVGNVKWLKGLITNSSNEMYSIDFDEDINIYYAGAFADGFSYDTNTVASLGFNNHFDAVLIKLDSAGEFKYAMQGNGQGGDEIAVGIKHFNRAIYWGGFINNKCIFGPDTLTINTPNSEMFISKISEPYLASIPNVLNTNTTFIFPNPNTGIFQIKTAHDLTLEIYNITSQLQIKKNIQVGTQIINATHLSKGIYFAKMYSDELKIFTTQKIIIQ